MCSGCEQLVTFKSTEKMNAKQARIFVDGKGHQWYGRVCYDCHLEHLRVRASEKKEANALRELPPEPKPVRIPPMKFRPPSLHADHYTEGLE